MRPTFTKYSTATAAYSGVLSDILEAPGVMGTQTGPRPDKMRERLNYSFVIEQPRNRLTPSLPLDVAVARFVWMMAANNRLADISFYEPKVSRFTDDGLTVPGSDYGMRLRQPQAGLDQISGAISRLRKSPTTRRAAAAIYQPHDSTRESEDIPCAFGLLFHNRSGKLHTTIIMRSNNALDLLPYNLFEFSMLSEVVAAEADLELGDFTYFAGSMHCFDNERSIEKVNKIITTKIDAPTIMPCIPRNSQPLKQLQTLGKLEAEIRHESAGISASTVPNWIQKITTSVQPYWAQFGLLLLASVAKRKDQDTLDEVRSRMDLTYREFVQLKDQAESSILDINALEGGPLFATRTQGEKVLPFPLTDEGKQFKRLAVEYESQHGPESAATLLRTQEIVFERIAARSAAGTQLTMEMFQVALAAAKASS